MQAVYRSLDFEPGTPLPDTRRPPRRVNVRSWVPRLCGVVLLACCVLAGGRLVHRRWASASERRLAHAERRHGADVQADMEPAVRRLRAVREPEPAVGPGVWRLEVTGISPDRTRVRIEDRVDGLHMLIASEAHSHYESELMQGAAYSAFAQDVKVPDDVDISKLQWHFLGDGDHQLTLVLEAPMRDMIDW
eukprot:TRINITY_DN50696_c0_g1_i1.p1 TRINITY_DN50696_c0_g1~~TRINITY_DN50696_c0_g1_i1.p1  ORF type:complete len:191 (-),score=28.08 TRINITY_DN50696_c0_g1_i1:47-619(-)